MSYFSFFYLSMTTSLADRLRATGERPSGFDYLRLTLAVSVLAYHSVTIAYGDTVTREILARWSLHIPYLSKIFVPSFSTPIDFIVPSFFALSGFLVAGSLERNTLAAFLTLRGMRIFPALCVEVLISALLLGPLLTTLPWTSYFSNPQFFSYFLNILGDIHYELPGVFQTLPPPHFVNAQLWTVPFELNCYLVLAAISVLGLLRWPRLLIFLVALGALIATGYVVTHPTDILARYGGYPYLFAFLFGVILYLKRETVPFNGWLALMAAGASWFFLEHSQFVYLAALPAAYLTVWLGMQNPRRSLLTDGADYSYGIYLYSYPVQQSLAYVFPSTREWYYNLVLGLLCSGFIAFLSWTMIEAPVLKRKRPVVSAVDRMVAYAKRAFVGWPNLARTEDV